MSERERRALRRAAEKEKRTRAPVMSDEETELDVLKSKVEELQGALEAAKVTFTEQLEQAENRRKEEVMRTCMEVKLKSLRELESLRQQLDIEREQ